VVKSLLLTPKKSYERKLKEMILAVRLERQLSKDEILYLYLNHIYLGSGAYGVAAAAHEYFGKRVEDLTLAEAALLAGLPQAPSRYSPFKHWPRAKARQRYVLDRMVDVRFITRAEAAAAARAPIALASRKGSFIAAPYYVEHVRRLLEERYGEAALYALGLRVHTPVNLAMQAAAEAALRDGMKELAARQHYDVGVRHPSPAEAGTDGKSFVRDLEPPVQGALVALDPTTGDVKAMVGGYDFESSQFNRAVQGARQPGSAFKPLIYAAALDRNFTPASIIVDAPISFQDHNAVWMPHNYEEKYYGPTTLREALTFSRNVVTVKLATRVGVKYLVKYIRRLGIRSPMAPNLSLALGSSEVTLLELAAAYSAFANQGQRAEPRFITRITDSQGSVIDENLPQSEQVISPETAYLITSMLQGVIERGTGRRAQQLGRPAAGKTGTTNDINDAWFLGYTPQLLTGLWVGFDEKRTLGKGETGGRVAAPIWARFMERALDNQAILDFPVPAGITFAWIDAHTGQRILPGGGGGFLECFRRGTEPTAVSAQPVVASAARERAPDVLRDVD
jgi:penicillin-binding protein 1A